MVRWAIARREGNRVRTKTSEVGRAIQNWWTPLTDYQKRVSLRISCLHNLGMPFVQCAKVKRDYYPLSVCFVFLLQTLFFCFGWFFTSFAGGLGPQESLKVMEVADGFELSL